MPAFHPTPCVRIWLEFVEPNNEMRTAPVSHQKRPQQSATNAIKGKPKHSEINEADRFTATHNGLVAGSSPAGPSSLRWLRQRRPGEPFPAKAATPKPDGRRRAVRDGRLQVCFRNTVAAQTAKVLLVARSLEDLCPPGRRAALKISPHRDRARAPTGQRPRNCWDSSRYAWPRHARRGPRAPGCKFRRSRQRRRRRPACP
jgi:hypothetical protein